jgi:hypothetical protein
LSLPYLQPYFGLSNSLQTAQAAAGGAVGGWVELARTTLGSAGDTISVSSLADKRYYMVLNDTLPSGDVNGHQRLNNDSGSNYSWRFSANGAAEVTGTSASVIFSDYDSSTTPSFNLNYLANVATKEKLSTGWGVTQNTAGAGTAPQRVEFTGKWANTSDAVNRIDYVNVSSGDFDTGSEVVVLGWDPADTHTSNFWEELGSADLSGGTADNLDITSFTAKKYLWIQYFIEEDTDTTNARLTFNNDSATNYSFRRNLNGSELTGTTRAYVSPDGFEAGNKFVNIFVVNNASNEKLGISNSITNDTSGAGTAPQRAEFVFKWANTADQITRIDLNNASGVGNMGTNSILKVWGSD